MIFDSLTIIGLALMVLLVAGWVFYNHYTEKIIRDLLKDVARLERENKRLRHRLSYDNEIKGAFDLKPVTATAEILDFPNSQRKAKKSERVEDVNKGFY